MTTHCTKSNHDTCYPPLKYSLKSTYIQNKNGKKTTIFIIFVVFFPNTPKSKEKILGFEDNNKK
jgi:uncharacterized membrane protein